MTINDYKYPKIYPDKDGTRSRNLETRLINSDRNIRDRIGRLSKSLAAEKQITNEDFEVKDGIHVFKEGIRKNVLEIMCNEVTINFPSGTQQFIKRLLDVPASHKDIQFLENFGIKKLILSNLIYSCNDDFETVEIVIFMLKNGFFTQREVLDNLELEEPIPFFNPYIIIDSNPSIPGSGFSAISKSKLHGIPDEIKSKSTDEIILYVNERIERLKEAVREDYAIRLNALEEGKKLNFKPKGEI